jgi:hypothetical protein
MHRERKRKKERESIRERASDGEGWSVEIEQNRREAEQHLPA